MGLRPFPRRLVLGCLLAALSLSCSDRSTPTTPAGVRIDAVLVSFSPTGSTLTTGSTILLSALASRGGATTPCESASWSSSEPSIASVTPNGPAGVVVAGISPGQVTIAATCAGVSGAQTIVVHRSLTLSGTVTDEDGRPLAGSRVALQMGKYGKSSETDSSGRYRVEGIPEGTSAPVSVVKDGYETYQTTMTFTNDTALDVRLRVGFVVSGRVTEEGIGPLEGATVAIVSGVNRGRTMITGGPFASYSFSHLQPGSFTIRASKDGFDAVERTVTTSVNTTVDFTVKSSYGSCLTSVHPVLVERVPSAGGPLAIAVSGNPERRWTTVAGDPWVRVASGAAGQGSGTVVLDVEPSPPGAIEPRAASVRIGCAAGEGQTVRLSQLPDCRITLAWTANAPTVFPRAGGVGHVRIRTGTPGCHWSAYVRDAWMHTAGISDWRGDWELTVVVQPNSTGMRRTGTLVVGETEWTIEQEG